MISIIIPVKNGGKYLINAVASAMNQQVDKEIIVIDDCSDDDSVFLLLDCVEDFVRQGMIGPDAIRIYRNVKSLGVAETRNRGVKLAKGEYIAFLDADDWWHQDKLKLQLKVMNKTGAKLCCTARELFKEDGKSTGVIIPVPGRITLNMLEKSNCINCSSVLLYRSVAKEFPMRNSDAHEDYLTWLKILRKYKYVVGINRPLLNYRLSKNGKSGNKLKSALMTYKTYCYAGYGRVKAGFMMVDYAINGIRKYRPLFVKIKGNVKE